MVSVFPHDPLPQSSKPVKIGSMSLPSSIVLAPMAGITDSAYRFIARRFGCGLLYSEMISSRALVERNFRTSKMLKIAEWEHPISVQIMGGDPQVMSQAARMVEDAGADAVDINLGCPVPKVARCGGGAALTRDLPQLARVLEAVVRTVSIPVTVKIRKGWDDSQITAPEVARIAQEVGVAALAIHPRTSRQGYSGQADWGMIAALKAQLSIPVIGSGDVTSPDHAEKLIRETHCDAVMIGRGALGFPWLFSECASRFAGGNASPPSLSERLEIALLHMELIVTNGGW
ncbi:MAG: tRNA dihydrouridine synthase DusB, partial [Armatimonadetes bacterium]|nr:tRNA dihydrouridine synthase DusB [Armatimonadota bacterium]